MNAAPRDRVASPAELEQLLADLEPDDALPYALAAYATGRRQELRLARWGDVDFDIGVILLGRDDAGRKSAAALRVVPLLRPLRSRLREEWLRQGRPEGEQLICPPRRHGVSGLLSMPGVARRARVAWGWAWEDGVWQKARDDAREPIGLHECRHTAASWMNAAGVNPKIASILMGHSTPERAAAAAAGAASITLSRYTHALPGDFEHARDRLDSFIANALDGARDTGS
jgi:integrase